MIEKRKKLSKSYCNDEVILNDLKKISEKLGHFPLQKELQNIRKSSISNYMSHNGGSNKFRKLLGYNIIQKPKDYWTDDIIIENLKQIRNKIGHFPMHKELRKMNRSDLSNIITNSGGINKFRNLLGEEIIKVNKGYWTEDIIINELKNMINSLHHFPMYYDFFNMKKEDLYGQIGRHGGTNKYRKLLGYEYIKKPDGYWSEEKIVEELKQIIVKLGYFPTRKDLQKLNKCDLEGGIGRYGGSNKFRQILGCKLIEKPHGYWTDETIQSELKFIIEQIGHFPSSIELNLREKGDLNSAIHTHGGVNKFKKLLNIKVTHHSPRFYTKDKITELLKIEINKLGHFPTAKELKQNGYGGLAWQINKNYSFIEFRKLLGYELLQKPPKYWSYENTLIELQQVIKELEHFPSYKELNQKNKLSLSNAINKYGGINKFREITGHDVLKKSNNYWTKENTIKELKMIIDKFGHFPKQSELKKMDRNDLIGAIQRHGGINKFRDMFNLEPIVKPNNYWTEDKIIKELKQIITTLGHFPLQRELVLHRSVLIGAMSRHGGLNKFRKLLGYEPVIKPNNTWNDELICKELKEIIYKLGYLPTSNELRNIGKNGLEGAIWSHGGYTKFIELSGYPVSEHDKRRSEIMSYVNFRGKRSENLVKSMIKEYCKNNNITFDCNVKLSKGNVLEFVCNTGQRIGIDVTNTDHYNVVRHKWKHQEYHNSLDELWILVFGEFSEDFYIQCNNESPDNVKIMSIKQFVKEIGFIGDDIISNKIDMLNRCTFSTKEQLIEQYKNIKTNTNQYITLTTNNIQNIEVSNKNSLFNF